MTLAALTGAPTFKEFDQRNLLGPLGPSLNETIFMLEGLCSSYPGMTHQYGRIPLPLSSSSKVSSSDIGNLKSVEPDPV